MARSSKTNYDRSIGSLQVFGVLGSISTKSMHGDRWSLIGFGMGFRVVLAVEHHKTVIESSDTNHTSPTKHEAI